MNSDGTCAVLCHGIGTYKAAQHISMLSMIMVCDLFVVYSACICYLLYSVKISTFLIPLHFRKIET